MTRNDVFRSLDSEREFQEKKWGSISSHPHEVGGWILLMETHLAKAREEWSTRPSDLRALEQIRKVAALAVACGEQHGLHPRSETELEFVASQR